MLVRKAKKNVICVIVLVLGPLTAVRRKKRSPHGMLLGTIAEDPLKFYRGVREDF